MKKLTKRLLALTLTLVVLISGSALSFANAEEASVNCDLKINDGQSFVKIEDENGVRFYGVTGDTPVTNDALPEGVEIIASVNEYHDIVEIQQNSEKEISQTGSSYLPLSVDNSQSKFFPEIGNQGDLGSCTFWSQIYYQFTYMMNKDLGVTTTADNTYSPQWAYNIIAGTDESIGTYYEAYSFMQRQGNVFLKQVPYTKDLTSFSPTEDIWKTSINNRIESFYKFEDIGKEETRITSPDDEDLEAIKTALCNGEVLTYSTYINSWKTTQLKTNTFAPENNKFQNEYAVVSQNGNLGAHRMTLVGYNDNIWIDINDNNTVDSGEMGAFKIANSWGTDYGNGGFIWVAYDALNEISCVEGVKEDSTRDAIFDEIAGIKVLKQGTKADLYLKYTLNTSDRTQAKIYLTAEKDGTIYSYRAYSNVYDGEKIAYDGSATATDATMILLLSNTVSDISSENLSDYSFSVSFEDTLNDSNVLTVKNAEIVDKTANKIYKPANTYPFTINGDKKTVQFTESTLNHAVVYYRGYENPMINYKIGNGNWISTSGVELTENTERRGYLYKYVIDLKSDNNATLYFTDKNGNLDNNNGKYFTACKGNNYYVTENVSQPLYTSIESDIEGAADINQCGNFTTTVRGGYAPYLYQFTFTNLDNGEVTVEEYDEKPTQVFYFRQAGNYKVTVDVMDFSDKVASASTYVEVIDIPFKFDSLTTTNESHLVGEEVSFCATTKYEKIIYIGHSNNDYRFVVMDSNGNVCFDKTKKSNKHNMNDRCSEIYESFIPAKSGEYTVTVSSTDGSKEYAEKSLRFTVFDKVIGDADGSGDINIMDTTAVQCHVANVESKNFYKEMADVDVDGFVSIIDATQIQKHVAHHQNCAQVGKVIEYIPPTEAPTQPPTQAPTTAPKSNTVTFTNSFNWSGTIYCYYWSEDNTTMTSWPGIAMKNAGTNEFNETMYTFDVPNGATKIIFTNGSSQTTDISYTGGEIRYYPIASTDSSGHNLVETW